MEATHMTDTQERELNALRHQMDLTHCPDCREPYDLEPCNARHARIQQDRLRVKPSLGVSLKAVLNTVEPASRIRIAHALGTWFVYSHDDMKTVPEGSITWDGLMSAGWKNEGHARAYLKRLAKQQPDVSSEWHIVFDATVNRYFIYVRDRLGA
jgi:hypothetical protein